MLLSVSMSYSKTAQTILSAYPCTAQVLNESGSSAEGQLSLSSLLGVVAPLLQQFIIEGKAGEDSGHEIKQVQHMLLDS